MRCALLVLMCERARMLLCAQMQHLCIAVRVQDTCKQDSLQCCCGHPPYSAPIQLDLLFHLLCRSPHSVVRLGHILQSPRNWWHMLVDILTSKTCNASWRSSGDAAREGPGLNLFMACNAAPATSSSRPLLNVRFGSTTKVPAKRARFGAKVLYCQMTTKS